MRPAAFSAEILSAGQGGHAVVVPKEMAATFSAKRPAVLAQVDGVEYHSRLAVYGGKSYLGLRKDLLRQIGTAGGRRGQIALVEEIAAAAGDGPRPEVTEPPELVAALAENPAARAAYAALPPSTSASTRPGSAGRAGRDPGRPGGPDGQAAQRHLTSAATRGRAARSPPPRPAPDGSSTGRGPRRPPAGRSSSPGPAAGSARRRAGRSGGRRRSAPSPASTRTLTKCSVSSIAQP